jgi:hypothetical protein
LKSGTTLDFREDNGQSIGSVVNSITLTSDVTLFNGFEVVGNRNFWDVLRSVTYCSDRI